MVLFQCYPFCVFLFFFFFWVAVPFLALFSSFKLKFKYVQYPLLSTLTAGIH